MTTPTNFLAGQTALVTGASSGIGREVARQLLALDVRVAFLGRSEERLREAAAGTEPGAAMRLTCDVRDDAQVRRAVAEVEQAWGGVDILVNSAGVLAFAPLAETSNETWDEVWQTNVNGTFYPTRAVVTGMLERGRGTIVCMSSVAGYRAFADSTAYCASKWAVTGFAKALSLEVRRRGVRVVTVSPGQVDTPMWQADMEHVADRADMLTAEEVARVVISAINISDRQAVDEVHISPQALLY